MRKGHRSVLPVIPLIRYIDDEDEDLLKPHKEVQN